ncbi:MAG: HDOD domain-containing protein [candidate division Zixibacteria bacterium]|nr:HDOD domain-containing protein [candidate division Zixibacteria bacterium]MDH3936921.1 HDOD domain-containing protein [candidate division Zixibacteria bacterium]MDH4033311.1 HDOD domain-containing protein [candidate division Zixibacteria bacterium]
MEQNTDTKVELDNIIATVGELPASPTIVSTVMGLTADLDSRVEDISKVLMSDQSLTAKVLKLSNSSFYGRPKNVTTLEEAIMILGFFTVQSMVVATSAHSMYTKDDAEGYKAKLWRHSLSAAVAARQVAKSVRHPEAEQAFIAALLHDIGKLVLLQKMPTRYQEIVAEVEEQKKTFLNVETRELGFNHCDVAALLLEAWDFPTALTEAIFAHHLLPPVEEGKAAPVAHVVHLGNCLAKRLGVGFGDAVVENLSDLRSAQALSLDEAGIEQLLEEITEHYEAEISIFEES